jgi:hypothetical protein
MSVEDDSDVLHLNEVAQLPPNPDPQITIGSDNRTIAATISSSLGVASGEPIIWTTGFCDNADFSTFDRPDSTAFGVNWISPQYEDTVDWSAIIDGISTSAHMSEHPGSWAAEGSIAIQGRNVQDNHLHQQQRQQAQLLSNGSEPAPSGLVPGSATSADTAENLYYVQEHHSEAEFVNAAQLWQAKTCATRLVMSQGPPHPQRYLQNYSFSRKLRTTILFRMSRWSARSMALRVDSRLCLLRP